MTWNSVFIIVVCAVALAVAVDIFENKFDGAAVPRAVVASAVGAITIAKAMVAAIAIAIASASAAAFASASAAAFASAGAVAVAIAVAGVIAVAAASILLLGLGYWRASRGAPGYAGVKQFGVDLGAIGGTRFDGADLRGAFFRQARLANTSFAASRRQPTRLERVCFRGARGLERARLGTSLLADPRVRQLLVTLQGANGQFEAINLRGAWLEQVDLRGANLRYADLSGAALGQAQLQQANLKACQCPD